MPEIQRSSPNGTPEKPFLRCRPPPTLILVPGDYVKANKDTHPDRELIESCLAGDEMAWNDLIDKYHRLIYSVAHTLSQTSEDTADVFQQVCLELYQRLSELHDTEALPAWLITVTRRQAG